MPAREIPLCVGTAYEQHIRGDLVLNIEHPSPIFGDPVVHSRQSMRGPINSVNKSMLLFLAARGAGEQRERAYTLWNCVRKLAGSGDAYEYEAASLLGDAMWPPNFQGHTRSQLKDLDDRLAQAAVALAQVLKLHPDFCNASSALNWPEDDAERLAKLMYGLRPLVSPDMLGTKENGAPILHHLPMKKRWQLDAAHKKELFLIVATISPTMGEMADVLAHRASELSSTRFKAKKEWKATGEANDSLYIRYLLAQIIVRNPDASPGLVAKIVSPIVDKALGVHLEHWQRTLDRCKKAAQTIKAKIKSDPDLLAMVMLSKPRGHHTSGK